MPLDSAVFAQHTDTQTNRSHHLQHNFFKRVVTEVILFSILVFKTLDISQGSVATQLRCGGIFSDDLVTNFLLIFENRLIFGKVKTYQHIVPIFWPTLYVSVAGRHYNSVSTNVLHCDRPHLCDACDAA